MDPILIAGLGITFMFVLILVKVPIGAAMAMTGFVGFGLLSGWGPALSILATEPVSNITSFEFAVIPLFLLMGSFATISGLSSEIYNLAYSIIGHLRGGLAMATVGGCAIFGAICGSSPATAATFGRVALPEMRSRGYSTQFASGCIAAGGTLGSLVPPSITMVVYAVLAQVSILDMFIAAVVPALMAILFHMGTIMIITHFNPAMGPAGEKMKLGERLRVFKESWAVVVILGTVIGGIYGGVLTVNEAAAAGVVLTLALAIIRRRLTWSSFFGALAETATNTAMIYLVIFGATIFSYFFTVTGAPEAIALKVQSIQAPGIVIIFVLILMYIVMGSIFETVSAMMITLPFVLPIITVLGYDPVWWGIINIVVMELGMITPPIGLNVFVLNSVADDISLGTIYQGVIPFIGMDIVRLVLLTIFPTLSLWLLLH
jgi:tripartite ATP-independent transporter DctM subunit